MDLARTLTAAVSKDGEWYAARCLEVEVTSQGESVDDALAALREALELYFEDDEVPASETLGSILTRVSQFWPVASVSGLAAGAGVEDEGVVDPLFGGTGLGAEGRG